MQIHDKIHIVGSGVDGIGLTHELDCTVYLIDGGNEYVLIDAGIGLEPERIIKNIEALGIDKTQISGIYLTHGHGDHSGGAYVLSQLCHATVYGLKETAEYVTNGDLDAISMKEAIAAGVYGKDYQYQACPVQTLEDESQISVGALEMTVHRMEGHCSGHACYKMKYNGEIIVFAGDSIFNYGKISLQSIWDCDLQKYIDTCRKLEEIHPDVYLPSHGCFLLKQGHKYIDMAMNKIRRLSVPDNVIE